MSFTDYHLIFSSSVPHQSPGLQTLPTTQALVPPPCVTRWSRWFNRDNPFTGDGDHEAMTPTEMSIFCAGGRLSRIECETESGIQHYSSGEIVSCSINHGFECLNANNAPIPCSDYKVRYYCDCNDAAIPVRISRTTLPPPQANHNTNRPITRAPCIVENCPPLVNPTTKQGEVVRIVMDDNNCCARAEVFCKPDLCTPPMLMCPPPMMLQPADLHDCCPTYRCSKYPTHLIFCTVLFLITDFFSQ